tara:strand:- start:12836 stop:13837 length:1002 start_codon:yes stop_codon:yes gene_type:complete
MIETIYVEESVEEHSRTKKILKKFPNSTIIVCDRYKEIFNRKKQNFRIQKTSPSLIIAKKNNNFVLPTPKGLGIGSNKNYYFSHMLNCLYDCRYCFLQGMYESSNFVLFINFESFTNSIEKIIKNNLNGEKITFFSGYDCDSLAMESITGFVKFFLPFFENKPNTEIELRTKSVAINEILNHKPFNSCIIAYSFTPDEIAKKNEHGAPPVKSRINAMQKLSNAGWKLGLRLDPLIYHSNYKDNYKKLIDDIFLKISVKSFHSISLGAMRFPKKMFNKISNLYPDEKLFSKDFVQINKMKSYPKIIESEIVNYCKEYLKKYIDEDQIFSFDPYL